ncbi:MAG: SRPBCC family protein [Steroidobacteraceae bacterium]
MLAQPDPPDSLVFECDFDEPPEKVWRALTEPRLLEAWLTTDASQGTDPREEKTAPPQSPEILTAEPHRLLRYGWRDRDSGVGDTGGREVHSVVTVELAPGQLGGTHLRLTHGDFRIVSAAPSMTAARVTPITSARGRRSPILCCATQSSLRRAA